MSVQISIEQQTTVSTEIPALLLQIPDTVAEPEPETEDYLLLCNDSVTAKYCNMEVQHRKSMFTTQHEKKALPEPRQREVSNDWVFGTVIVLIALASIYLNTRKFKIKDIILSLFDTRTYDRISRENNIKPSTFIPMSGLYFASLALMSIAIMRLLPGMPNYMPEQMLCLLIFTGLCLYILIKNSLIRLLGNIFEDSDATTTYISNSYLFYYTCGTLIPPLMLLIFFGPVKTTTFFIYATVIIIATVFIIRLARGFVLILSNSKTSKLYLFYYLCILEIVPILALAKIIIN